MLSVVALMITPALGFRCGPGTHVDASNEMCVPDAARVARVSQASRKERERGKKKTHNAVQNMLSILLAHTYDTARRLANAHLVSNRRVLPPAPTTKLNWLPIPKPLTSPTKPSGISHN